MDEDQTMNWDEINAIIRRDFALDPAALMAALHEVDLCRDPAYLKAVMVEDGSPADGETAIVWWGKKRGQIWRQ
jgi:hypothetical protein